MSSRIVREEEEEEETVEPMEYTPFDPNMCSTMTLLTIMNNTLNLNGVFSLLPIDGAPNHGNITGVAYDGQVRGTPIKFFNNAITMEFWTTKRMSVKITESKIHITGAKSKEMGREVVELLVDKLNNIQAIIDYKNENKAEKKKIRDYIIQKINEYVVSNEDGKIALVWTWMLIHTFQNQQVCVRPWNEMLNRKYYDMFVERIAEWSGRVDWTRVSSWSALEEDLMEFLQETYHMITIQPRLQVFEDIPADFDPVVWQYFWDRIREILSKWQPETCMKGTIKFPTVYDQAISECTWLKKLKHIYPFSSLEFEGPYAVTANLRYSTGIYLHIPKFVSFINGKHGFTAKSIKELKADPSIVLRCESTDEDKVRKKVPRHKFKIQNHTSITQWSPDIIRGKEAYELFMSFIVEHRKHFEMTEEEVRTLKANKKYAGGGGCSSSVGDLEHCECEDPDMEE